MKAKVRKAGNSKAGGGKWKVSVPSSPSSLRLSSRFEAAKRFYLLFPPHTTLNLPAWFSVRLWSEKQKTQKSLSASGQVSPLRCATRTGKVEYEPQRLEITGVCASGWESVLRKHTHTHCILNTHTQSTEVGQKPAQVLKQETDASAHARQK